MPENRGGHLEATSGLLRWAHPSAWHRVPHHPCMCHPGRHTDWLARFLARRTRVPRLQPDSPLHLWPPSVRNESTSPPCVTNTGSLLGLCSWLSTLRRTRGVAPRFSEDGILIPASEVPVSGSQTPDATVHLVGAVMVNLVGAIPRVQELFELPVIVGGLAVMSRLGNAYRVTQDLDALRRRLEGAASSLEVLRAAGATDINEIGGLVPTERGDVRVDLLEARHNDLDREFTDPTDRLEAMAHQWTLDTATPMHIVATTIDPSSRRGDAGPVIDRTQAVALVARPGPLVAMKLKASIDRTTVKEATDLLDVIRLVTDPATAGFVLAEFKEADAQLVEDVAAHAHLKFRKNVLRTRRIIRDLGPQAVDAEFIDGAADFLEGALWGR